MAERILPLNSPTHCFGCDKVCTRITGGQVLVAGVPYQVQGEKPEFCESVSVKDCVVKQVESSLK